MTTRSRVRLAVSVVPAFMLSVAVLVAAAAPVSQTQPPRPGSTPAPAPSPAVVFAPDAVPGQATAQQKPVVVPSPAQTPVPTPPVRGPEGAQPVNVKVDVTITDQTGSTQPFKKSISVTVADRQGGMIRSSIQIPVATTTFQPAPSATSNPPDTSTSKPPMTSYQYKNVNLNLDVREVVIEGNFVRLRLTVEYSPVDERADVDMKAGPVAGMPSFASFQQTLSLVLENGKPLQVAQSSDPVPNRDRKQTVEVRATILK
jgi:hypothetical protein